MRKALLALAVPLMASLQVAGLPSGAAQAATHSPNYYVSLGDSYAVGYQPGLGSTPGYTVYVAQHTRLSLVNFGCAGATTTSILSTVGCAHFLPHTAGGTTYPTTTQIAAADAFLTAHRGHVGLITVVIGGLEVTGCAVQPDPVGCLTTKVSNIYTNVATLASDLRAAAGPKVRIVGLTYPDSFLGGYVWPKNPPPANTVNMANLSVTAFKSIFNPALSKAYTAAAGSFVDVTQASGSYLPLTRTVSTRAFGTIPQPVASICAFTWFCTKGDIHPRTAGYTRIGKLVVARYRTPTHA